MTVLDYSNPNGLRRTLTGWCRKWSDSGYTPPRERGRVSSSVATGAMGASVVVFALTALLLATPCHGAGAVEPGDLEGGGDHQPLRLMRIIVAEELTFPYNSE